MPERTKVVENNAFESCTRLKTISVPASVEKFGGYITVDDVEVLDSAFSVFIACNALEQVNVAEGNKYFKSIGGLLFYKGLYEGWYGSSTVFHDHTDGNVKALVFVPISAKGILKFPQRSVYVSPARLPITELCKSFLHANDGGITKVTFAARTTASEIRFTSVSRRSSYAQNYRNILPQVYIFLQLPLNIAEALLRSLFRYARNDSSQRVLLLFKLENVNFEEGGREELTLVGGLLQPRLFSITASR